jgi:Kef-type K+ transport system membrane component KefB
MAVAGALSSEEIVATVFVDIAIVIVVARLVGALFKKIRQPAVVGEILAGIALGPTLLGAFPGDLPARIFPLEVRPALNVLAQLGLIIFMFIVGLELDVRLIRGKERIAAVVSVSSIALPFVLGVLLAAGLHSSHRDAPNAGDFLPFALFIGASMSITAFPVLARILTERRMYRTEIGALTLACAAVDDILAWSLLAVVLAIVASTGITDLPRILIQSALFVTFMFVVVRPRLEVLAERFRRAGRLTPNLLAVVLVGFLTSAWITSEIGIHSIFGAFLFGVIMPREDTAELFHQILERLEQVSVLLLLPVFFIVTGLSVDVRGLGSDAFTQLPLILLVACAGKFLGASAAARAQGLPIRKATAIGVLMNTRGLTELVILNVGLEFGVLDERLFTMLVVMAVFTTVITEPALRLVYPDKVLARDIAEAEKAALGVVDAYRVVVAVDDPGRADHLARLATDLVAGEDPAEVVLSRMRPSRSGVEVGAGLVSELAEVASSLDALKSLSRRVEERGVPCVVRAQFSDDPARDLAAQAAAVEADLLLVPAAGAVAADDRLWRDVPGGLAVVTGEGGGWAPGDGGGGEWVVAGGVGGPAPGPTVAVVGDDDDATAAVELAARRAWSAGSPLWLVPADDGRKAARRVAALAERLAAAGLACEVGPPPPAGPPPAVVVVGGRPQAAGAGAGPALAGTARAVATAAGAGLVVHVRAAEGDGGRGLDRLVQRLKERQPVTGGPAHTASEMRG